MPYDAGEEHFEVFVCATSIFLGKNALSEDIFLQESDEMCVAVSHAGWP